MAKAMTAVARRKEKQSSEDDSGITSSALSSMAIASAHGRAKKGRERASSGERGASGSSSVSTT
jgi:hypothetical protein